MLRLTRDSAGFAPRADLGTTLLESPKIGAPTSYEDTSGLSQGKFYYYTVWVRAVVDGQWRRAGDVIGLVTQDWGYSGRMFELLPSIYREKDMDTTGFTLTGKGQLERFLTVPGFESDHVRTEFETLKWVNDADKVSGGLLPLMADQLGFGYEGELGMRLARQQLRNAVSIYKRKGARLGVEAVVSVLTGWAPTVTVGKNLVLDQNDGSWEQPVIVTVTASTTNASAVVTASTATFSAADVGRTVAHPNLPAYAVIITYTSSTQVTVSANATATGSGTLTLYRSAGQWVSTSNATLAARSVTDTSAPGAIAGPVAPPVGASTGDVGSGSWMLLLWAVGAGDMVVQGFAAGTALDNRTKSIPVTEGVQYTASIYSRALDVAASTGIGVEWFNIAGTSLGAVSWGTSVADFTANWNARPSITATAPAGAAFMRPSLRVLSASAGNRHLFEALQVEVGATPTAYQSPRSIRILFAADRVNLVPNASLESNITGWTGINATLAQEGTVAFVGTKSLKLTATGAGGPVGATTTTGTGGFPVTPLREYTASAYFRAATMARDVRVSVYWYTAAGAPISMSSGTPVVETTTAFTRASLSVTAPSTAAFGAVIGYVLPEGLITAYALKLDDQYVQLPGTGGNYASTPDSAALSITGDIDLRAKVALDDWLAPTSSMAIVAKYGSTANQRSYMLWIDQTTGRMSLWWSTAGTVGIQKTSLQSPTAVNGQILWIRATLDVDNGASGNTVTFYTSQDGVTYVALGASIITAGVTSIFDGTATATIGAYDTGGNGNLAGKVYYVEIRNGIGGTRVGSFSPLQTQASAIRTPGTASGSTGETWTLNGSAWQWGAYPSPFISAPDSAALSVTGDIDMRAKLTLVDWGNSASNQAIIGKWSDPSARSYVMYISPAGALSAFFSTTGSDLISFGGSNLAFASNSTHWVRVTRATATGTISFYSSEDGVTWAAQGTAAGATGALADTATALVIGGYGGAGGQRPAGIIHYAEVRNGIAGPVAGRFDPVAATVTGAQLPTTLTNDATVWTITGSSWSWVVGEERGRVTTLRLTGATGNFFSTPDSAAVSITGDIDLRAEIAPYDWTPVAAQLIINKEVPTTQRSWGLKLNTTGNLVLRYCLDGTTAIEHGSSVVTGFVDGSMHWVQATRVAATGVIKFWTSVDGVTWIQLGTDVAGTAGALFDSTAAVEVGARNGVNDPFAGDIYYAEVRSGVAGPVVASFDARGIVPTATRTPSTYTAPTGEVWTGTGSAWDWQMLEDVIPLNEVHYMDAFLTEEGSQLLDFFDGLTLTTEGEYIWAGTPGNSATHYYSRRLIKNSRLNTRLPEFLPAGSSYALLYAAQS